MPIDYSKYPPDWEERRERILKRAENKCEFCGVKNYAIGFRDEESKFIELENSHECETDLLDMDPQPKVIKIVLTIAHLDHDETNWEVKDDRLAALCQNCHLKYDAPEKARRLKSKKAIGDLFE